MASKLTQITNGYHTFVDNQVLTKDQLNEFGFYFEDQDRLSRVFLHGVGVVCGFKLSLVGAKITITQGVGVTTDGDLVQLKDSIKGSKDKKIITDSLTFSHYRKFEDDAAFYQPFRKLTGKNALTPTVIDLYELLTEETENSSPLSKLAGLKEMEVILYLESYGDEGDLCTAIDCDNQGTEQVNRLKVLLLSKVDAEFIAANDPVFSEHNVFDDFFNLPQLAVKRVVLNQINTSKYEELKRAYSDAIKSDNLPINLKEGITEIVKNFGGLLDFNLSKIALSGTLKQLDSILSFKTYFEPFDIQYRYDFLKDLVDTYDELVELLLDIKQMCLPDITAFPKHLMLGLLSEISSDPKHLRHEFYPAATEGCEVKKRAASLFEKMLELINNYLVKSGDILITPSNKLPDLSKRSIPFYYQPDNEFLKSWNFDKTRIYQEKNQLTYHRDSVSKKAQFQDPLLYNTDTFDFYRIEGHQGKDYRDVLEELDDQKKKYGLSFDVKALSVNINTESLDIDDYECEFEDLKVMLKAWTAEQDCILAQVSSFFSSFSTRIPGANAKEAELDLKSGIKEAAILTNVAAVNDDKKFLLAADTSFKDFSLSSGTTFKTLTQLATENTVVKENMSVVEDTLGVEMKKTFDETKGGSVNDIIANARTKIQEKVNTDEWNADPVLKDFVANKSVELMAHTFVLTQRMPVAVNLVDTIKVSDYKLSLSQLCALVKRLKAGYQSTSLSVGLQSYTGLLINQLSTVCCSGKKLEILLEEINTRKEQILLRLQLSKFIEKHPGLEHKAGVEPGGTFVLVYKNKEVTKAPDVKISDSRLISANDLTASKLLLTNKILNLETLSSVEKNTVLKSTSELIKYEDYLGRLDAIRTLDKIIPSVQVPDNTVVADFALPYMCCSDCAPINYIISKPPVTLRLERDKYCLLTDTDPILYQVSPADGVVEMNPVVAGVSIENGKIVILADAFPSDMIGKPIHFMVNQQVTDAVLTVFQGVVADFKVPEEPTDEATQRFEATGQNLDGATFFWDFGDGNSSSEKTPTHTYKLPVNDENKVTVSLTVTTSNGICKTNVEHELVFIEIKPTIQLKQTEYCENDKNEYPFIVTPAGAKVEISGPGVVASSNGGFSFIPAAAGVGTAKFLLNGEDSGISVNVNAAPQAGCVPKQVENQLIISNTSKNANRFSWNINGTSQETTNLDPIVIDLTPNSPVTDWKIVLTASGADVCPVSRTSVAITTKFIEETPVNTCFEDATNMIQEDAKRLAGIKSDPNGIITDILTRTQQLYGGTTEFGKGVLNELDLFLKGGANDRLDKLFSSLLKDTAMMIIEMSGSVEIQQQFILLFELQLRLFYLILGCQNADVIKKFADLIQSILKQIIDLLVMLRERKVVFSDNMKKFISSYAAKVSGIEILAVHTKTIIEQKLI